MGEEEREEEEEEEGNSFGKGSEKGERRKLMPHCVIVAGENRMLLASSLRAVSFSFPTCKRTWADHLADC